MTEESQSFFNRIKPEDRIYYTRVIFGFVAATICLGLNLSGVFAAIGFVLGAVLIGFSYLIPLYILGVNPEDIGGHVKGVMKGLGTGILLFLVVWLLLYNFYYAAYLYAP